MKINEETKRKFIIEMMDLGANYDQSISDYEREIIIEEAGILVDQFIKEVE
jgi:hypothetical protein